MKRPTAAGAMGLAAIILLILTLSGQASAADTASVRGKVIDAATGLALSGVLVQTEGPTINAATTDRRGDFEVDGLQPGYYNLLMHLDGYVTTESDPFRVDPEGTKPLTLALQRGQGIAQSTKVLGVTTV